MVPPKSVSSYDLDFKAPSSPAVSQDQEDIEPQEVRDERARDAKLKFKDLDQQAKVRKCLYIYSSCILHHSEQTFD